MFELVLFGILACLKTLNYINSQFLIVIPNRRVLDDLLSSADLSFSPGLFRCLQAPSPPTIAFLKRLPTIKRRTWAVYVLVLEKAGHRPRIYVGSGTCAKSGAWKRRRQYENRDSIPLYVRKSWKEGFVITHQGTLCTTRIPAASRVPTMRALFLAIEALFAFLLGAHYSHTAYGMGHSCLWQIDALEYDGLCSRTALMEGFFGDVTMTAEQLEEYAEIMKKKLRQNAARYRAKMIASGKSPNASKAARDGHKRYRLRVYASKRFYCAVCDQRCCSSTDLRAHFATQRHADMAAGIRKNYCDVCRTKYKCRSVFQKHLASPTHLKRVAAGLAADNLTASDAMPLKPWHCAVCDYRFDTKSKFDTHCATPRHIAKATGAKKHYCALCDHEFCNPQKLRMHIQRKAVRGDSAHVRLKNELGL